MYLISWRDDGPVRPDDLQRRGARRQRDARGGAAASRAVQRHDPDPAARDGSVVALFIREGKRLHLAPAGQVLLGYAERLLALADEARGAVQDARPRGTFRLGAMESTAAVRLPGLLSEYHRRHPGVILELRTGNPQVLGGAILAGELDAALVAEPIADVPFEKAFAFDEELVIVAPAGHPPIGKKGQSAANRAGFRAWMPASQAAGRLVCKPSRHAGAHHRTGVVSCHTGMRGRGHGNIPDAEERADHVSGAQAFERPCSGASRKLRADRADLAQGRGIAERRRYAGDSAGRSRPHQNRK